MKLPQHLRASISLIPSCLPLVQERFFSGIAGAYHAAKLGGVSPDNFSFGDSVIYLAMVVIGGIGSIPGVIVGALAVYAINQLLLAQLDSLATDPSNPLYYVHNAIVH